LFVRNVTREAKIMTEDYKGQCEFCLKYYPEEELTTKDCGNWSKVCCESCFKENPGIEGISEDLTEPELDSEPIKVKGQLNLNLF